MIAGESGDLPDDCRKEMLLIYVRNRKQETLLILTDLKCNLYVKRSDNGKCLFVEKVC